MNTPVLVTATVDISTSTTISDIIDLQDKVPAALVMPSALTSTAITFTAAQNKTDTFKALTKASDGNAVSVVVAASKFTSLSEIRGHFFGVRYLKLVMGSAEAADREIGVVLRPEA